jgi:tRNA pseudouridine55 synthase
LTAARVRLDRAEIASFTGTHVTVALTCSAGFYVRSFAHELGERIGVGACVERLRRVRSGEFTLAQTVTLDRLQGAAPLPLGGLLPGFPSVSVTVEGAERVSHGRELELRHCDSRWPAGADGWVRILGPDRELLALGRPAGTALHPAVVLT